MAQTMKAGFTVRSGIPEESLLCSEGFAAHMLDAVAKGAPTRGMV